jgi:tetratricopeptide (TPR) repeat protein
MKKLMFALMLATPMVAMAIGTETTPAKAKDSDYVVGKRAVDNKDWQVAIRAFSASLKNDPDSADTHNYLGYSYRNTNRMELSFKHYNEALRLDPNHLGANEYIGWAYLKTNRPAQAEEHLARLERICGRGCDEYQSLNKGIADFKAKKR